MPRYFFDVVSGSNIVADEEGTDLPSLDTARSEAVSDARYLMSEAILRGEDVSHKVVQIRDDRGDVVLRVPFADTIRRQG